jgi:nicotinamidase-related amidase
VTVDPKTTALLMLDFMHQNCNKKRRPRCVASLPLMKKLLGRARAKKMTVVYSIIRKTTTKDIWDEVAPKPGEPWVLAGADKFFRTDLEKILKSRGINTVITVGTAAQGAVIYTASGAALRGMKVIVPLDGVTAENLYFEQYVAYHLVHAPTISSHVTLTTSDMIKF